MFFSLSPQSIEVMFEWKKRKKTVKQEKMNFFFCVELEKSEENNEQRFQINSRGVQKLVI